MTIEKMLEKFHKQRDQLNLVINYIELQLNNSKENIKKKKILKEIKKKHWTQTKIGKEKMKLAQKKAWIKRRQNESK